MNTLLIDALACRNRSRPPIWLMRQAGRYMPEYRAIRARYSFLEMCHTPEIAAEVTKLPLKVFGFDAAILFSDILVIPEALGLGLHFTDGTGPVIERPLETEDDIAGLTAGSLDEKLAFVKQAIQGLIGGIQVPLIGFTGAPFTLASYMIEGKSSRDLKKTKKWMLQSPESFHQLLEKLTAHCARYLEMQIEAGVQAVQIFDSWAHVLAYPQFIEFSLQYTKKIIEKIKGKGIPTILFCKGSSYFAPSIAESHPNCISVDWNADLPSLRKQIPNHIALQGNLDPDILYAPIASIKTEAERLLNGMKNDKGFIFNLGHGILPDTPADSVKALVEFVKCR